MRRRLSFLLCFYAATVIIFLMAKVVFMLCYRDAHPFTAGDVCDVAIHGLSLDLSTALYFLIIPFLATMASVWVRLPQWLLHTYCVLIALAFALAFVADTSLYEFWQFKLDASSLQYLETPTDAMASVTTGYLVMRFFLILLTAAAIDVFLHLPLSVFRFQHSTFRLPLSRRLRETALYIVFIPLMIIGIRGGIGESTTNIGQVYYSNNQFLNHAAVNPVFSFLSSLGKSGDYLVSYDYYSDDECRRLTKGLFDTRSQDPDTLLTTTRPNILIVLMESCGGQFTEMGGHPEIMPQLNQLCREGVFFAECYANSWRTDKGVVSVLSGYPAFPITSVMKVPEKSRKLPSIASSLQAAGYESAFFYGGDINFTNMRSYVMSSGYERLRWKADYSTEEQQSAQWGVRDDLMFASLLDDIRHEQAPHWMKTVLTLSSHEPWDVPTHELSDKVYNAFHYLDDCLGNLIDSLRQTPQWRQLLVVILPDHGYRYRGVDETTRLYNHIPMLWTGGAVKEPRIVSRTCNQSDLAATLLGQMQLDHSAFTFSRDVLGSNYRHPMAWHTFNNGMTLIDSTAFTAYDLDAAQVIATEGGRTTEQLQQARALLQLTSHDLIQK